MEESILISYLNDFIYCPVSIYFHKLYGNLETILYQNDYQINGTNAHKTIDTKTYSTKSNILQGICVYSSKYNIQGKIDVFDIEKGILIERKNYVSKIYDGFIFQVYAQYFGLIELGYDVKKIRIHSKKDNKNYNIEVPFKNKKMLEKFERLLKNIRDFDINSYNQDNISKCERCIYEPACDRSLLDVNET